jgi:hypothetical protein
MNDSVVATLLRVSGHRVNALKVTCNKCAVPAGSNTHEMPILKEAKETRKKKTPLTTSVCCEFVDSAIILVRAHCFSVIENPLRAKVELVTTMSVLEKLNIDPLNYVANLNSPIGIYLRKKLSKKETALDAALKKELYGKIVVGQSADGSWDQLFVKTANNLWNLALLGFDAEDPSVKTSLQWLLSIQKEEYKGHPGFFYSHNRKDPSTMRSTYYGEFGPGCTIFYQTTYAIHLFHLFGFDDNKRVETTVSSYLQFWKPTWCGTWCTTNVLNVLIEHPLSKQSKLVESALNYFADLQSKTGTWKDLSFYHVFHALSRANNTLAKKQLDKALPSVIRRQNNDASWGRKERQTETFLVLDALINIDMAKH